MEPETPPPWPFFLLFPCLPKKEKTNKTMLLGRGCLLWAWDYLDALPPCSCHGWSSSLQGLASGDGWGLWASAAFLGCTLLPQLTSAL